jgi:hypothetical protein
MGDGQLEVHTVCHVELKIRGGSVNYVIINSVLGKNV